MSEFLSLTRPAYALVPTSQPDSFHVTLDGVEMAGLYLDKGDQEWALSVRAQIETLPEPFRHYVYTFATWSDLVGFLGIDAAQPADPDANTVEDVVDMALRKADRTTYGELRAELARREVTPAPDFGGAVAEHRRLRQAHAMVARGIAAGLTEIHAGRSLEGLTFLAEAHGTATHHAGFARSETLPAEVPVLARVRADRSRRTMGGARG